MNSNKNFLIYGKRSVYEALESNVEIDKVFIQKNNSLLDNIKSKILISSELEKKTKIIKKGKDIWCCCPSVSYTHLTLPTKA